MEISILIRKNNIFLVFYEFIIIILYKRFNIHSYAIFYAWQINENFKKIHIPLKNEI